ncbi:hypothetical protein FRX31_017495 [Thalictrum thalictroides]|uniref:Uncharacterized protein n=1 Tax=Thalictrum thalictroides TaxID=46969 RepID=A0A7J6W7W3_THATH|nr:hypothetical protein FRX31_017495 [Thalictrum thalictroides]
MGWNFIVPRPYNAPFRLLKLWTTHHTFKKLVEDSWGQAMEGTLIFVLANKLKRLKGDIKIWNKTIFGKVEEKLRIQSEILCQLQQKSKQEPDNEALIEEMYTQESIVENLLDEEAMILQQKTKVKWENEGERCFKYFFLLNRIRRNKVLIREIKDKEGRLLTNQDDIADFIVQHFEDKFKKDDIIMNPNIIALLPLH